VPVQCRRRAQLDRFPTSGSGHYVYALANRGARLLRDVDGLEFGTVDWNNKNREVGRPFIEHQIEIVSFQVALERAAQRRPDLRLVPDDELVTASWEGAPHFCGAFTLRASVWQRGKSRQAAVVPDVVFALSPAKDARRNFMVEIDRGTMRVRGSNTSQTSFEGKLRMYIAAHAGKQHERQFGWKNFRALTVTTAAQRIGTMQAALRDAVAGHAGAMALFLFTTFDAIAASDPLAVDWRDGAGRRVSLM
jgi:Replication-relaxation